MLVGFHPIRYCATVFPVAVLILSTMTWVSLRTTKMSVSRVTPEMLDVLEFFMALFDLN